MNDEPYTLCPYCEKRVDPDAPRVVFAVERRDVPGFGQVHDFIDEKGGFFHPHCSPESMGWVRRHRPGNTASRRGDPRQ
jgi:hypothetical protein